MRTVTITLLAVLLVAGCARQPLRLSDIQTEQRLAPTDAVTVRLDPAEFARTDALDPFGRREFENGVETGPLWKLAFTGTELGDPYFSIKSTVMKESVEALGFAMRHTYIVDGELLINGQIHQIHAEGSRASGGLTLGAMRQAAELGIKSAADQCRALME